MLVVHENHANIMPEYYGSLSIGLREAEPFLKSMELQDEIEPETTCSESYLIWITRTDIFC